MFPNSSYPSTPVSDRAAAHCFEIDADSLSAVASSHLKESDPLKLPVSNKKGWAGRKAIFPHSLQQFVIKWFSFFQTGKGFGKKTAILDLKCILDQSALNQTVRSDAIPALFFRQKQTRQKTNQIENRSDNRKRRAEALLINCDLNCLNDSACGLTLC